MKETAEDRTRIVNSPEFARAVDIAQENGRLERELWQGEYPPLSLCDFTWIDTIILELPEIRLNITTYLHYVDDISLQLDFGNTECCDEGDCSCYLAQTDNIIFLDLLNNPNLMW